MSVFRQVLFSLATYSGSLVAQQTPANPPPAMPWVAWGECPGESCSLGEWLVCKPLIARTEDRRDAPVAFRVKPGERIEALASNVHVEMPGIVVFRDTGTYVAAAS